MMKFKCELVQYGLIVAAIALQAGRAVGELIPADRLAPWVPWVTVGVPRGIPTDRTNLIDVTKAPYYADRTGMTNTREALIAAIRAAKSNDVVYLPAGRYRLEAPIQQLPDEQGKSFITIRGAGPDTIIDWRGKGAVFSIGRTSYGEFMAGMTSPSHRLVGGLNKGSSNVVVNSQFDWKEAGRMIRISQKNDSDVISVNGYEYVLSQMAMVMGVNGSNVSIWPPLCQPLKPSLDPAYGTDYAWVAYFVGLEDLAIDATNTWSGQPVVTLGPAYGCWIRNVQIFWAAKYGFMIENAVQCEIRGCMCYGSKHAGPEDWSNHGGLVMGRSTGCLVEDNVTYKYFPGFEINGGCCGNVFAYNFLEENNVKGIMGVALDSNHSPHNHHNLYEGNVASKFQCDGYYGGASDDTVFRNWFHGTCPGTDDNAQCINLNRFSYRYSLVGNVLGTSNLVFKYDNRKDGIPYGERFIYALGLPNIGNGGWNGKYGPPWEIAVRDGGTNRVSQVGNRVRADHPFFTAGMVGHWFLYDDHISQNILTVVDSRTILVGGSSARTNEHFVVAPPSGSHQEIDTNVLATVIRLGNFNFATTNVPPSETLGTNTLPPSLFYSSRPAWWPAGKPWPPIGPDRNPVVTSIPAQDRFHAYHNAQTRIPSPAADRSPGRGR